jgi:hypothetical protein
VLVNGGDQWKAVGHRDFVGRQGEAKVGLGKGGHRSPECSSKSKSTLVRDGNRKEGCFVVVNGEASGILKNFQNVFGLNNSFR